MDVGETSQRFKYPTFNLYDLGGHLTSLKQIPLKPPTQIRGCMTIILFNITNHIVLLVRVTYNEGSNVII